MNLSPHLPISSQSSNSADYETYLSLGATLYIPTSRSDLHQCVLGDRLKNVRSLILCTEDAINEHQLGASLDRLSALLEKGINRPRVFVRPRSPQVLSEIMKMSGSEQFAGYVLPKIDHATLTHYQKVLSGHPPVKVMITVETPLAFVRGELDLLCSEIKKLPSEVICIRIGANDLMGILGLKRSRELTIYDTPLRQLIDELIYTFRLAGYHIAAPVFDFLDERETLKKELSRDLAYGLWSKTAIHPEQISLIEAHYRVDPRDLEMAEAILAENALAVFKLHGQMCEPNTHRRWAEQTLNRAAIYGSI